MIVLNTTKELIKVEDWETILSRPAFTDHLNPADHKLTSIIGSYNFKDKIRCGLSNCHTPHNKGYIAVTTDGRETNMGTVCGKTHFGVEFETFSRQFDEDIQEKRDRDYLWDFHFKLDNLKSSIDQLRSQHHGGDWAYKKLRAFLDGSREFSEVSKKVGQLIRAGSSELMTTREATEEEVRSIELGAGKSISRPHYIDQKVATLAGIAALYKENDLRDLLIIDLSEGVKAFEAFDIDVMTRAELRKFAKWAGTVESTFERSVQALEIAKQFLTDQNLKPLLTVLSDDAKPAFTRYLAGLN